MAIVDGHGDGTMKAFRASFLLILCAIVCTAAECQIRVEGLSYPPLAAQARIQGVVVVHVRTMGGQLTSKPSTTGHPLLVAVAQQSVDRAQWTDCEDGEHELRFDFQLTDPCSPRPLSVDRITPASFRVAMSQPNPCIFIMSEQTVRRLLFWKKKVVRCEEHCPPCELQRDVP